MKNLKLRVKQFEEKPYHFTKVLDRSIVEPFKDLPSLTEDIQVDGCVELVGKTVIAKAGIHSAYETRCVRCLAAIDGKLDMPNFQVVLQIEKEDTIDLTENIREDIILALSTEFLCKDTCKGLCFHCGKNLNKEKCACKNSKKDTGSWKALDEFKVKKT